MTRSLLFVPGDSARKFERAAAGDADALILDLEDSVSVDQKPTARTMVREMIERGAKDDQRKQLWVRINAFDTGFSLADLAAVVPARPYGIVLPKCRNGEDVKTLANYLDAFETTCGIDLGSIKILPIATELGSAMFGMGTYSNVSTRLWGVTWGAEDLAADLGALTNRSAGAYTEPFRMARTMCLYAAADAGIRAFDTVTVDIENLDLVKTESIEARRDGFTGKMAIHPKHIPLINEAFAPSAPELDWAKKIVAAFEADPNLGAFRLEGKMIDRPHLRAARRLLGES